MRNKSGRAVCVAGLGVALMSGCGIEPQDDQLIPPAEQGTVSQGLNVITNGSFEQAPSITGCFGGVTGSSSFSGWTLTGSVTLYATGCKTPAQGVNSIRFGNGSSITQMVPTVVGAGYTVQFAQSAGPGCTGTGANLIAWQDVVVNGTTYNFSTSSSSWTYRSVVFNATSTSTPITFKNSYSTQPCLSGLDNVTVTGP